MSDENGTILDLGSIDFTPDWAKKDAGVNVGKIRPERDEREKGIRDQGSGIRKSFGDRKSFGEKKPFTKKPFGKPRFDKPRFAERPKPLEAEVKILPETKALGTIIRKLQADTHAYKLKDLAYFFLDNPSSVLLKITSKAKPESGKSAGEATRETFYQCKACGFASTSQDDVITHILSAHLADYYDETFRHCDTTIYAVGGSMPGFPETLDVEAHAEGVAKSLEYLIKERDCRKIRFYCLTNELMCDDQWAYFWKRDRMPGYRELS